MPPTSSNRRQSPLSREALVDVSIRIAREHGIDALTMRAVATELDVTPMALYYHVRNKDELVGLIAQTVMADVARLELGESGWELSLRVHLLSLWETLARYRGLASYMINLPTLGTTAEGYRAGSAFFESAGFSPRMARLAWSFALTFIHGRLSVDARLDRSAAEAAGLDGIIARDHVAFGVDAVIEGLKVLADQGEVAENHATGWPV